MKEELDKNNLTLKEQKKLVRESQQGSKEARNILIVKNMKLVLDIVSKYDLKNNEEDLISYGLLGLIKGIDNYTISNNSKFSTYATSCIINEINKYIARESENKRVFPLSISDLKNIEDFGLSPCEQCIQKEEEENIRNILNELPEAKRKIVSMYFGIGDRGSYKQVEIAGEMKLSQARISKIIVNSKKQIKRIVINSDNSKCLRKQKR